jgi:hypothetical protein
MAWKEQCELGSSDGGCLDEVGMVVCSWVSGLEAVAVERHSSKGQLRRGACRAWRLRSDAGRIYMSATKALRVELGMAGVNL